MDLRQTDRCKSEVLDQVFEALAASEAITSALVFKGARILVKRLESIYRQSTDIDSNLLEDFVEQNKQRQTQADYLEKHAAAAIKRHFESQEPVRTSAKPS
jgi:Nucleotidyl transferase AbiEii toxin, Type IV TA system